MELKSMKQIKQEIDWGKFIKFATLNNKDKQDIYNMIESLMGLYSMGDIDPYGTMKVSDGSRIAIEVQYHHITIYKIKNKKLFRILKIDIMKEDKNV